MEKPHSFAGKVIHKYGKTSTNDYAQPEKFFADMAICLRQIEEIPFSAVEDLEKYELNRNVMVHIVSRIFKIFDAAGLNVADEIRRQQKEKDELFEGLEEDLAIKKQNQIKISGEKE